MEMFLQRHTARCKGEQNDPNTRSASALLAIAFEIFPPFAIADMNKNEPDIYGTVVRVTIQTRRSKTQLSAVVAQLRQGRSAPQEP